jgi:hypothetical protein
MLARVALKITLIDWEQTEVAGRPSAGFPLSLE